jgi:hypothetical protein
VDGRLIDPASGPHPRRFALGPFTTVRTAAAFARPRTNAPAFRFNDAAARAVLRLFGRLPPTVRAAEPSPKHESFL